MVSCPIGCLPWPMGELMPTPKSWVGFISNISNETANGKRKLDVEHDDDDDDDDDDAGGGGGDDDDDGGDDDDDDDDANDADAAVPSMLPSLP